MNAQWYGCGATLLSCDPLIIVSAAHCFFGLVDNYNPDEYHDLVGKENNIINPVFCRLSSFSISTLRVACGDHVSKSQCLCLTRIT